MLHVVLVEPEIPQNTGNIARTCAATGAILHLVHPLGFSTEDRWLRRAGLDYWHLVEVVYHDSLQKFLDQRGETRMFAFSSHGRSSFNAISYPAESYFLFGRESEGLPEWLLERLGSVRIPIRQEARSLNLSNAAAIAVFEWMRQQEYPGLSR